jgi:hypothetical protein
MAINDTFKEWNWNNTNSVNITQSIKILLQYTKVEVGTQNDLYIYIIIQIRPGYADYFEILQALANNVTKPWFKENFIPFKGEYSFTHLST